jgi:glycosyltransferase involved in cell wall biosynthesis
MRRDALFWITTGFCLFRGVLMSDNLPDVTPKTIVLVNAFLGPYGGAEVVVNTTARLLREAGHQVYLFGTNKQPYFEDSLPHQDLFPEYQDFDTIKGPMAALKALPQVFYNRETKRRFKAFLDRVQPDLVHVHGFLWHLSPSVIDACVELGVRVIHHVHDSRLFCPAGTLMRGGEIYCEEALCATGSPLHAVMNRCYDQSLTKSTLVAAEFAFRRLWKTYEKIDHFICPSQALKAYAVKVGIPAEKITVVSNPIDLPVDLTHPTEPGKYLLYVGRLSKEKGVMTLLEAMRLLPREIPLWIIGTGPEEAKYKAYVREHQLDKVTFLGWVDRDQLHEYYRNCVATIAPSKCFEAFGYSAIECLLARRPVIANNLGGLSELIVDQQNGYLVHPLLPENLSYKIQAIWDNRENLGMFIINTEPKRYTSRQFAASLMATLFNPETLSV